MGRAKTSGMSSLAKLESDLLSLSPAEREQLALAAWESLGDGSDLGSVATLVTIPFGSWSSGITGETQSLVAVGVDLPYNKPFKFVPALAGLHRTRAAHAPLNSNVMRSVARV